MKDLFHRANLHASMHPASAWGDKHPSPRCWRILEINLTLVLSLIPRPKASELTKPTRFSVRTLCAYTSLA